MSRSYLLADVMAAIRNAMMVKKPMVKVPHSRFVFEILSILKREGYINECEALDIGNNKKEILVDLKYIDGKKDGIQEIELVSKPSRRIYLARTDVRAVLRGHGLSIVSTSKGLFTDKEARQNGVGGELVMKIW